MEKIYILMQNEGQYEDYRSYPIMSSNDNSKLEAYLTEQKNLFTRGQEVKKILELRMTAWESQNPRPPIIPPCLHNVPTFQGIKEKDITKEMRDERARLREENQRLQSESVAPLVSWGRDRMKYYEQEKSTFTQEEQAWVDADFNTDWEITEIPFI